MLKIKAAQVSLAETIDTSCRADGCPGVSASAYCVGYVDTPMIRGFERLGVKNPLTPEQAAEDIVRAVERRELMGYAPLQLAWLVSMLAHVPNVPDFVTRHIYTKNEVGGRRAVAKAEAEGHAIGQTLAYKMRTVDVTRRLSMYKRSEGKKTN